MPTSPFESYKNPDGTYDGVKMMAEMTGLSEAEVQQVWEKVKSGEITKCPSCGRVGRHFSWCPKNADS